MEQPPLVSGMILGGVLISALGAGSSLFLEEKKPSVKSISRDFIIGAIMVALIIQLLPDSSTTVIQFLLGLVPASLLSSSISTGGSRDRAASSSESSSDDMEVKVGVPRF
jgi:hypothetical protein